MEYEKRVCEVRLKFAGFFRTALKVRVLPQPRRTLKPVVHGQTFFRTLPTCGAGKITSAVQGLSEKT